MLLGACRRALLIPWHDTFERVFDRLDPQLFQLCFRRWVEALAHTLGIAHLAIDSKTLRGSGNSVPCSGRSSTTRKAASLVTSAVPDPRFQPFVVYHKRFLLRWRLSLFLFQLGSRRQLDFQLNTDGPEVLDTLNRLAGTDQDTPRQQDFERLPETHRHRPILRLLRLNLQRLLRMKALAARVQGRYVMAVDGTGYLLFCTPHCEHCLTRTHGDTTRYMHQALEAKFLGPAQTVLSIGTAFIANRDVETADGVRQVYRWVEQLSYTDGEGRTRTFTALQCEEQPVDGPATLWAWVTGLAVNRDTVVEVATKGVVLLLIADR